MRLSASFCQSSRYRLLTLKLVLLLGILCAQTVGGVPTPNFGLPGFLNKSQLIGGEPLAWNYRLTSRCKAHVQITPARGRQAIHARDSAASDFGQLTFESRSASELRILGVKTQKYLCFSRKGRVIARYNGHSKRCSFHLEIKDGYIMLQSAAEESWYVGFNKHGLSKPGYTFPGNGEAGGRASVNSRPDRLKKRGKKRKHGQDASRRGKKRRHQGGLSSSSSRRDRASRKRGRRLRNRVRNSSYACFQFTTTRTDEDRSDPRVRNELKKKIYDPLKYSDLSKLISTPDPR